PVKKLLAGATTLGLVLIAASVARGGGEREGAAAIPTARHAMPPGDEALEKALLLARSTPTNLKDATEQLASVQGLLGDANPDASAERKVVLERARAQRNAFAPVVAAETLAAAAAAFGEGAGASAAQDALAVLRRFPAELEEAEAAADVRAARARYE